MDRFDLSGIVKVKHHISKKPIEQPQTAPLSDAAKSLLKYRRTTVRANKVQAMM